MKPSDLSKFIYELTEPQWKGRVATAYPLFGTTATHVAAWYALLGQAGAVFVFIFSLVNFSVPDILRVGVYPVEIFIQFSAFYNEKAATLLSLPLILIAFRGGRYVAYPELEKNIREDPHPALSARISHWIFKKEAVFDLPGSGPLASYECQGKYRICRL